MKRLNRGELLDIIYELQKQNAQAQEELQRLQGELEERNISIAESGSIAEAALKLNGVFEAAQAAADQYLLSVRTANTDITAKLEAAETRSEEILRQANRQAEAIVSAAQARADEIVGAADRSAADSWDQFQKKADELLRTRAELDALVKRN